MNKPEVKPEDVAHLWTLICCFQTARYCMSQIGGIAKKGSIMRDVIKRINKDIQRFLKIGQRQATAEQKKVLDKHQSGSVTWGSYKYAGSTTLILQ